MEQFKITKPVRLIELFSGIGTQAMALKKLGVPFESWKTSDIDVNAVKSYKAIHCGDDNTDYSEGLSKEDLVNILHKMSVSSDGKNPMKIEQLQRKGEKWLRETYNNFKATKNLGSVMEIHAEDLDINEKDFIYILTYSFPCQDLSLAGKQAGMKKGDKTRSSLLWQVERILYELKDINQLPSVLVMENVTQVHGTKNIDDWNQWLNSLNDLGYQTYWQDLNAKNYGIAQNRNRCFAVSILNNNSPYIFPEPIELTKRLKDYLEPSVDEKYYINSEKADKLIASLYEDGKLDDIQTSIEVTGMCNHKWDVSGNPINVAHTLLSRDYKGWATYVSNGVVDQKIN